jgi:hypothetical protein
MSDCPWCGREFHPRRSGGSPQRFCCKRCHNEFWTAGRRFVSAAVEDGTITVEALRALVSELENDPEVITGMAEPSALTVATKSGQRVVQASASPPPSDQPTTATLPGRACAE